MDTAIARECKRSRKGGVMNKTEVERRKIAKEGEVGVQWRKREEVEKERELWKRDCKGK